MKHGLIFQDSAVQALEKLGYTYSGGGHWKPPLGKPGAEHLDAPGYESLAVVLADAFAQAAHGKGKERHAQGAPYDEQPMQRLIDLYGPGFALGQAAKKSQESQRLPHERARAELLGAICYLAGAVIAMDRAAGAQDAEPANDNAALAEDDFKCHYAGGCRHPELCALAGACQA